VGQIQKLSTKKLIWKHRYLPKCKCCCWQSHYTVYKWPCYWICKPLYWCFTWLSFLNLNFPR